jgi:hypothetical protein
MERVRPSTEWDQHEDACARAGVQPGARPEDADARWEAEVEAARRSRDAA